MVASGRPGLATVVAAAEAVGWADAVHGAGAGVDTGGGPCWAVAVAAQAAWAGGLDAKNN